MDRPDIDVYMMGMALMASTRATCSRRSVGCVIVNRLNHIVGTGYNGPPRQLPHCGIELCPGMRASSGTQLDGCMAIHAEQNALLQCGNTDGIRAIYATTQPCLTCTKLLLNTSCERIVYLDPYPHIGATTLWIGAGRTIEQIHYEDAIQLKELFQMMSERSESALTESFGG